MSDTEIILLCFLALNTYALFRVENALKNIQIKSKMEIEVKKGGAE